MNAPAPSVSVSQASPEPFLRLSGLRKIYPGVVALADFSMEVRPGEIIGLVGENGAGKSTLMNILGGVIEPDGGTIEIDGVPYKALTVAQSIQAGIAFVHQELNLFDNLNVAANVYIGREPRKYGVLQLIDTEKLNNTVQPFLDRLGASFSPTTPVSRLSLAQQQMVEIAKALSFQARLVILDEPTSSLPHTETEKLMDVIRSLKAEGISIIFISHRLAEVEHLCDRVLVLRDGELVGGLEQDEIDHDAMVRLMIGREIRHEYLTPGRAPGDVVLQVRDLRTAAHPSHGIDLDVRAGEILGLAGLVGSGRTEFARVVFGIDPSLGGTIAFEGTTIRPTSSADAVKRGIFLVPEDRKAEGILLDLTTAQNITLPNLAAFANGGIVSRDAELKQAEHSRVELGIRTPSVLGLASSLSGGNQQKVVVAKWLAMNPKIIIMDEPTRGIDVGAIAEIYRLMRGLADAGVAVLMISSDMEEVIGVSDRVAVMQEGRIAGVLDRDRFSEENILRLAVGKPLGQA